MMAVALDMKQHLDDSTGTTTPILHPSRIERMMFVRYSSPPVNQDDRGAYEMWLECVTYLCDDLHWLLQQPHAKFWCQIIFDETLHKALDSFLRYSPRSHDALNSLPDNCRHKHLELCRLVFMTFLRMSTHKESKDCFITPSVFGEILYENFLFDIPKILDICTLFGKCNGSLLTKMISNIFAQQPNYKEDLRQTVPTIVQVFNDIASRCGVKLDSSSLAPQKLDKKAVSVDGGKMAMKDVQDLVVYLNDIGTTLIRFLEVYPDGCQAFSEVHFCNVLANFFETVVPVLSENVKQNNGGTASDKKRILILLHQSKKALLSIFHHIVNHTCLLPVLENGTDVALVTSRIEEFLHIMTSALNERRFLAAYEGMFVFQEDVELLQQASACVDASQFDYIQSAINSAFATFGRRKAPHGDTKTGGRTSPDGAPEEFSTAGAGASAANPSVSAALWNEAKPNTALTSGKMVYNADSEKKGAAASQRPSEVELESLICAVKDILPHLGDGFIEAALGVCGWDQERVISCVLEDSLPASLSGICFDTPRQERAVNQGDGQTDSLVDSRRNVFDNDEFDVFHNKNVKEDSIHQGKKKLEVNLEEKSVVDIVRARYNDYGSWERNDPSDPFDPNDRENQLMYEDEYDDTYDTTNVGADDADSADELLNRRVPRVLADLERKKAKMEGRLYEESGDTDSDEESCDVKKDEFVQDPAKLREQAAQRRQSQAGRGRGGGGPPPRSFDVKGAAKGQGQSKEVVNNRRAKEKFKGQRNRNNADKKMSKGMF